MFGYFLNIKITIEQEIMLYMGALAEASENMWGGKEHTQSKTMPAVESILSGWAKFELVSRIKNKDNTEYFFQKMISEENSYALINNFIDALCKTGVQVHGLFMGRVAGVELNKIPQDFFFYYGKTLITTENNNSEWLFIPNGQEKERVLKTPHLYETASELYFMENGTISTSHNFVKTVETLKQEFTVNPPVRKLNAFKQ